MIKKKLLHPTEEQWGEKKKTSKKRSAMQLCETVHAVVCFGSPRYPFHGVPIRCRRGPNAITCTLTHLGAHCNADSRRRAFFFLRRHRAKSAALSIDTSDKGPPTHNWLRCGVSKCTACVEEGVWVCLCRTKRHRRNHAVRCQCIAEPFEMIC